MPGIERLSTVTAPASSYDLTDLATVKSEIKKTDTTDDDLLAKYITWSSLAIENEVNRALVSEAVQDNFLLSHEGTSNISRHHPSALQLSRWPIVSVTSVTESGTALVANTDFVIDAPSGRLLRLASDGNVKTWRLWPTVVAFIGGYGTLPGDLVDAAVRMAKNRWNIRGRDPYLRSEVIPGVRDASWWIATGNEAGNMPPDIVDLLDNYRVPVIA